MENIKSLEDLEAVVGKKKMDALFTEYSMRAFGKPMDADVLPIALLKTDEYGNNIDFSEDVLSNITIKGLLGKWTHMIISDVKHDIYKFYAKTRNIDAGDKNCIREFFMETNEKIHYLTPILEDLCNENLYGIEDIMIAVFGVGSDEVFVLREFLRRMEQINEWDEDYMWNDFAGRDRLKKICLN